MNMLRRFAFIALLTAALFAAPDARAQFQPFAMRWPGWTQAELVPGHWSDPAGSSAGMDLLAVHAYQLTAGSRTTYRNLLPPFGADPYLGPSAGARAGALAPFDASVNGRLPDAAWGVAEGISVAWSANPGALDSFPLLFDYLDGATTGYFPVDGMGAARLLSRTQPVLLAVAGVHALHSPAAPTGFIYALDLAAARGPPATLPPKRSWPIALSSDPARDGDPLGHLLDRAFPIRLSPAARSAGIDDVIVPFMQGFFLLWHDSVPVGSTLDALDLLPVSFGVASGGNLAPFLPPPLDASFTNGSCLGAAAADVDGDGVPDLVFSYGGEPMGLYTPPPGTLLWIRNTGNPATMAAQPWSSLAGRADLPITNASTLRQLDLGSGEAAFAFYDRTDGVIRVVRGDGASGFRVTTLPVAGGVVRDIVAIDVVGSPARDLVALVDLPPSYSTSEVWVFPDDDDMATTLAFSPELPTSAPLGVDLLLGVAASDRDVPATGVTISWLRPVSPETVAHVGGDWAVTGLELCSATSWDFKVRALDDLGVYTELSGSVPVEGRPALRLTGAAATGPLVLLPGGVSARAEGEAWPACATGAPGYTWEEIGLGGLIETHQPDGSGTAWIDFTIPEAAYPAALAGTPALRLTASGPTAAGPVTGATTVELGLDARGLVSATVAFDQSALAEGEVGLARVRISSRIGVSLPGVRAVVRLVGLVFAGPMRVTGASATAGPGAGEVVVDPLPALPGTVEIDVPVRSLGLPGAVSVELYSGSHRVSPEASPSTGAAPLPGCGCGDRGAGPLALLLALALPFMKRRRRST